MKRIGWALLAVLACAGEARAQLTTQEALLDSLQHRSFLFFWNEANPLNGLIRDRSQPGSPCSIASQGFGLSSICVAIDHGWVGRAEGATRVLTALQTFWNGPQGPAPSGTIGYKGFFYHFLDMNTALRMPGWNPELSTIDTALLLAGILDAKQYFDGGEPAETQIRALADSIYRRVDWTFFQVPNQGLLMGWKPDPGGCTGFCGFGQWVGYNEAMIMYILGLGSPTHALADTSWKKWTSGYQYATQYGQTYVIFPPLFGHQYSHCWIDFRYIQDAYMRGRGITYFENSRRATYAQRAYSIANPLHWAAYGDSLWGLTAGDGPNGYIARGAPPAQNDDGTISPTAAASSIPFAPEICIPVVRNLYNAYGGSIWGDYAFTDAFNPSRAWWDLDVIGIDQGPMVLMVENWLTGSVWNRFMRNLDVQRGLAHAGFTRVNASVDPGGASWLAVVSSEPNPFRRVTTIRYRVAAAARVRLAVYDLAGREVAVLVDGPAAAGVHDARWAAGGIASGIYYARLTGNGLTAARKLVLVD